MHFTGPSPAKSGVKEGFHVAERTGAVRGRMGINGIRTESALGGSTATQNAGSASFFGQLHPIGWLAIGYATSAGVFHIAFDTRYMIGNLSLWQWFVPAGLFLLAATPDLLHGLRIGIESVSSVTKPLTWVLVWVVFGVQFFNVATRYGNDLVERDIYFGEAVSIAWQAFALIALLGLNHGVRDGVNPRIDFWWAEFSDKTKAALDFTIHSALLLPFTFLAVRLLRGYASIALGQRRDGQWPNGWGVWETWEQAPDAGQLPVGPIKAMLLVGFVLFGLQVFAEIIKTGFVLIGRTDYGGIVKRDAPLRIE